MHDFVLGLDDDWFLFKYEQMIDNKFDDLNNYLGFEVQKESQVPEAYGKVVRKKSYGDWRHWFTTEDVGLFKPAYLPYMQLIGYDCDDWEPSANPVIDPDYSSKYMQSLPQRVTRDTLLRYKERALRFFQKRKQVGSGKQI
jgi:hypothetical protein